MSYSKAGQRGNFGSAGDSKTIRLSQRYPVQKKEKPLQGSQLEINLFGTLEKVGFYNTFAARKESVDVRHECATLGESNEIVAIKGESFIGYQFHPESILTKNGFVILQQALTHLL